MKVIEDIRPAFKSELSVIVLIDFSKAFDTVNFDIMFLKLAKYFGFSKSANSLMKSHLSDRYQYVTTTKSTSSLRSIHSGVPQGSILRPILFSMFRNDIVGYCTDVSMHLYADDAQIYLSRPPGLV